MKLNIRDLRQDDVPELHKMVFGLYEEDDLEIDMTEDIFARNVQQGLKGNDEAIRILVFEAENGKLAGYAMIMKQWSGETGGWTLLLDELYVNSEFRGQGIASTFFDWLEEEYAHKVFAFYLETSADNEKARRLYRRIGFEELSYKTMCKPQQGSHYKHM